MTRISCKPVIVAVQQVQGDVGCPAPILRSPAGQARHLPVRAFGEVLHETLPDHPERTDHERMLHLDPPLEGGRQRLRWWSARPGRSHGMETRRPVEESVM